MLLNDFEIKVLENKYKVKILSFKDTTRKLDPYQKITMQLEKAQKGEIVEMWAYVRSGESIYEKAEYMSSFKSAYKMLKTKTYDYVNKCSINQEEIKG